MLVISISGNPLRVCGESSIRRRTDYASVGPHDVATRVAHQSPRRARAMCLEMSLSLNIAAGFLPPAPCPRQSLARLICRHAVCSARSPVPCIGMAFPYGFSPRISRRTGAYSLPGDSLRRLVARPRGNCLPTPTASAPQWYSASARCQPGTVRSEGAYPWASPTFLPDAGSSLSATFLS